MLVQSASVTRSAVFICVAATQMVSSSMATDWVVLGAVSTRGASKLTVLPVAPETDVILMGRRVGADLVETGTIAINVVTSNIFNTGVILALVAILTLIIRVTATKVFFSLVATDGVSYRAVFVNAASVFTLKLGDITVGAVLVVWDVACDTSITATGVVSPASRDTHVTVTDEALKTLDILVTATEVFSTLVATDGVSVGAVVVRAASIGTLFGVHITVVAVSMIRHVTHDASVTSTFYIV